MGNRNRSLLGRFVALIRGNLLGWMRDREERSPRAVYEQAIQERTRHYADLKRAVAGILYMRNKLEAEITERLEGRTFGYWGGATDGPRCVHIGSEGGMGSPRWRP